MKYNLLSVVQLIEKGFLVRMHNEVLELFDASNNLVLDLLCQIIEPLRL